MAEKLVLIFGNGTRFEWNTGSIRSAKRAMKLQRKHGNPVEIIGSGLVAQTLRQKYEIYHKDPKNYKSDLFGTAAKLSGKTKEDLEGKFKKISKRLGIKTE